MIPQLEAKALAAWQSDTRRAQPFVVDVREPWEFALCRVPDSVLIPLGQLGARVGELPRDRPLVMVCHTGRRSQNAALMLEGAGFREVQNLRGGVAAWASDVDPTMARY